MTTPSLIEQRKVLREEVRAALDAMEILSQGGGVDCYRWAESFRKALAATAKEPTITIYLLYYEPKDETGSREEWNVFYTPCEIFLTKEDVEKRKKFISTQVDEDGNPVEYDFHVVTQKVMTAKESTTWNAD